MREGCFKQVFGKGKYEAIVLDAGNALVRVPSSGGSQVCQTGTCEVNNEHPPAPKGCLLLAFKSSKKKWRL